MRGHPHLGQALALQDLQEQRSQPELQLEAWQRLRPWEPWRPPAGLAAPVPVSAAGPAVAPPEGRGGIE